MNSTHTQKDTEKEGAGLLFVKKYDAYGYRKEGV